MLPAKKNKIDISKLSPEEQKLFRLYGKLPDRKDVLANKLKERKYFDSGDYALSKAGKADSVGSQHPSPENIPHSNPTTKDNASPTKESSLVHDTTENLGSTPAVVAVKPAEEVVASNPTTKDNASPAKESLVHDTTEDLGSTPAVVAVKPAEEVVAP